MKEITITREQFMEMAESVSKEVCKEYGIGQCWAYKIKRKEHWVFNDEQ